MKSRIQMNVAKHMIAVWTDVNDKDSLADAFDTINRCWPGRSRRVLRSWAKALHKNPERYEFTGYAFKALSLFDHFDDSEVDLINTKVRAECPRDEVSSVIKSIIHFKWVYGMNTEDAIKNGMDSFYGKNTRKYRPAKPVLKPLK